MINQPSNIYTTQATADSGKVVSANPCRLRGFTVENTSASTRWVHVFNLAALPTAGAIPITRIKVLAGSNVSFSAETYGELFLSVGLVVASSSTGPTWTDPGAAELYYTVSWV